MEGSNYRENVRAVRARKKGRKMRRKREKRMNEKDTSFRSLLVHYSIAALSTPDCLLRFYLVLPVAI